ncbi:MAG TPA: helix-turn-helix transcriptional regulator [Candidatus Lokiarchaeia archaeon]|nr:helix-turn-helix transcriptional regulator [Candidatus Lokiarchaeia archaeon]
MFSLGKAFQYRGRQVRLSAHEFITLLKIRMATTGISGYKLIHDLARSFAGSWSPQSGTMYPILKRLAKDKELIIEKLEKTPIGPAVSIYQAKDDLGNVLDSVLLDTYKSDIKFFENYIEFLVESIESSMKSEAVGIQVQEALDELIKNLQGLRAKLDEMQAANPAPESKCPSCGAIIDRAGKFCPSCGTKLDESDEGSG